MSDRAEMNDRLSETLSALMDGEASELELRRLLASSDDAVDTRWQRYHLVREVLQGDQAMLDYQHLDISQRVNLALGDEPQPGRQQPWWRPVAGFAVAASVAVAVVFGVQGVNAPSEQSVVPAVADSSASPGASSRVYPLQAGSMMASTGAGASNAARSFNSALPEATTASRELADLEARKRLDKYLLRHTERAALGNGQGMMSFARVASFEAE